MYTRTLLFLWAVVAAFGLLHCEGYANPHQGSTHQTPKSHPPGNKGHVNAKSSTSGNKGGQTNAKSSTPGSTGHANTTTNSANKSQTLVFPQATAGTQHHENHAKDSFDHKQKELHEKKLHEERAHRERMELRRIEQEIAFMTRLLQESEHHRHHHAKKNDNTNNPSQQQNGQQQPSSQQTNGQQQPSRQQNGSTGEEESGQPQIAQGQETPGSGPTQGIASNAFQYAENLLRAAIHQMEEALAHGEGHEHRKHHLAEAHHLLDEAIRKMETVAQVLRHEEHPRLEAQPKHPRA